MGNFFGCIRLRTKPPLSIGSLNCGYERIVKLLELDSSRRRPSFSRAFRPRWSQFRGSVNPSLTHNEADRTTKAGQEWFQKGKIISIVVQMAAAWGHITLQAQPAAFQSQCPPRNAPRIDFEWKSKYASFISPGIKLARVPDAETCAKLVTKHENFDTNDGRPCPGSNATGCAYA